MPYIKKEERQIFNPQLEWLRTVVCTSGQLNYVITLLLNGYLDRNGKNYAHINDCVGALECAKQEFYRRVVAPYEDKKIQENGDV